MQSISIPDNALQSRCADEKIHIPGAVQPHGVLIACTRDSWTIAQVSDSSLAHFGISNTDLVGRQIEILVGKEQLTELSRQLSSATTSSPHLLTLAINCKTGKRSFAASVHQSDELIIIELEEAGVLTPEQSLDFFRTCNHAMTQLLCCPTRQGLLDCAAEFVRDLTGFDRVMIYLFDEDWNGTVFAESKASQAKSYLGLKFPATDIPAQARALYLRSPLRLLANVDAVPSTIFPQNNPQTSAPLDLSQSILRAMSPVHIEYLKNMEVAASMSLSLISNGELRGLIACHHTSVRQVEPRVRQACDFLARLISLQIDALEERETFARLAVLKDARKDLLVHISNQIDLPSAIVSSGMLLNITGAQGAAVVWDEGCFLLGKTPDQFQIQQLLIYLTETSLPIFVTDSISKFLPSAQSIRPTASGLLAIRLAADSSRWLLWFRPEQLNEVSWAGKQEDLQETDHLNPRKSFAIWKETVHGRSKPWVACEIQSALELRTDILDASLSVSEKKRATELEQKVKELDQLSQDLKAAKDAATEASQRKSEMVSVVSHDLRAPLTSIKGSLWLLNSGDYQIDPEVAELVAIACTSCDYLLNLINNLLNLETIESGGILLQKSEVLVGQLIEDAFQLVRSTAEEQGIRLESKVDKADSITTFADKDRLTQVLVNLISNSIKFSPPQTRILVSAQTENHIVTIKVTDQGRGVPEEFRESIFERFKQVDASDRGYKGGAGLGLAICKTIVEAHNGTIGVDSQAGKGSTFWFSLPTGESLEAGSNVDSSSVVTTSSSEVDLLKTKLAASELTVSKRTRERNDFEIRLIESDHELELVQAEFVANARIHAENLATLKLNLSEEAHQLNVSDEKMTELSARLRFSVLELKAMLQERGCFVEALDDLRNPISGATEMLAYIATKEISPQLQSEVLSEIIEANKRIVSAAHHLTEVAQELSQRTRQLMAQSEVLSESNSELRTRMQQREDFVAALTHDLKNPLIGATRILELCVAGSFAENRDEQTKILNLVVESNKSMLRMIWNMLDVYRQESGSLVPVLNLVDVSLVLSQCLKEFSFNIEEKKLILICDTNFQSPLIMTDKILLRRVLFNLLDNGVKFSPPGSILTVGMKLDERQLHIFVKDSGPGMSETQLNQIFRRFWQTKEGRSKGIGTGLGLFSSKLIMHALNGDIECASSENGTTFTVIMPLNNNLDGCLNG